MKKLIAVSTAAVISLSIAGTATAGLPGQFCSPTRHVVAQPSIKKHLTSPVDYYFNINQKKLDKKKQKTGRYDNHVTQIHRFGQLGLSMTGDVKKSKTVFPSRKAYHNGIGHWRWFMDPGYEKNRIGKMNGFRVAAIARNWTYGVGGSVGGSICAPDANGYYRWSKLPAVEPIPPNEVFWPGSVKFKINCDGKTQEYEFAMNTMRVEYAKLPKRKAEKCKIDMQMNMGELPINVPAVNASYQVKVWLAP